MKIIIYPGSFDPVHHGHLLISRHAKRVIGADRVLFLLSPSTVWKKVDTAFTHRQNMLAGALSEEGFEISLIEEENEGKTNYTFITLQKLKALYPADELYLLLGEDQAQVFDKWMNPDEIAAKATILVYKRKGSKLPKHNIDRFKMVEIEGPLSPTSSSLVRNFDSIDVPTSVLEYIGRHKLYFAGRISKYLSDARYFHSFEVAKLSRLIAIANELDDLKAFKAGFLHDIGKEVPDLKTKDIMIEEYREYLDLPLWSHHQFVSEYISRTDFLVFDADVLHAIKNHATGNKRMKSISKVVYAADKIEPTRGFDSSDLIASCIRDYEQGFVKVLNTNKEYLQKSGKAVDNRLTNLCFKAYLK